MVVGYKEVYSGHRHGKSSGGVHIRTYVKHLVTNRDGCLSYKHFFINSSPPDHGIDEVLTVIWEVEIIPRCRVQPAFKDHIHMYVEPNILY